MKSLIRFFLYKCTKFFVFIYNIPILVAMAGQYICNQRLWFCHFKGILILQPLYLSKGCFKLCLAICKTLGKTLDELFWEE